MKTQPKLIETKTLTIKMEYFDNGTVLSTRTNDGFKPHELLGIMEHAQLDVISQMSDVKVDEHFKRSSK